MFNFHRDQLSIIEKEHPVKEIWFQAFYEGNSLVPQTAEGIDLCMAISTLLKDKYMKWEEFEKSKLSPMQIRFLGKAMTAQHRHKGIEAVSGENSGLVSDRPKIINDERLRNLWEATKFGLTRMLLQYIFDRNNITDISEQNRSKVLEVFFKNPKYKLKVDQLKKTLVTIERSLYETPIQKLLTEYREGFRKNTTSMNRGKWMDTHISKLKEILTNDIAKAFNGNLPADVNNFILRLGWHESYD